MFNFIKDFTIKIIEKLHITINMNKTINLNNPNYNLNYANTNTKKYYSISKKSRILILLFIDFIYILIFFYSFYLIKNPFIEVSFLKIFPSPFPKVPIEIFYLFGYIFLYKCLTVFNKEILTRYFYKFSLMEFIIKYIISIFILLSIFSNIFVFIIYMILKFLFITTSLLKELIEYLLL